MDRLIRDNVEPVYAMHRPTSIITPSEVQRQIYLLRSKKSLGCVEIDEKAMEYLLEEGIPSLVLLLNSILGLNYLPIQWKCAKIIMIHDPGKPKYDEYS